METLPAPVQQNESATSIFDNSARFEHFQRVAKAFSSSDLAPQAFKGNIPNTLIALDMADRLKANPLSVMQSIYVVHGRPSWAATFIIGMINASRKFSPLRFEITGEGDDKACTAWARELESGDRIDGPPVSIRMAKEEGWYGKNGSKWKTMPDLMLRYRAATFFGRLYCPELLMGMTTTEEVYDIETGQAMRAAVPHKATFGPALFAKSSDEDAEATMGLAPAASPAAPPEQAESDKPTKTTPQAELAAFVVAQGFTFDDFRTWATGSGQIDEKTAENIQSFDDLDQKLAQRLLRAPAGLVSGLKSTKA